MGAWEKPEICNSHDKCVTREAYVLALKQRNTRRHTHRLSLFDADFTWKAQRKNKTEAYKCRNMTLALLSPQVTKRCQIKWASGQHLEFSLLAIPINFNGDYVWGSLPALALENAAELAFRPGAGVSLAQVEQVDARVVGQSHHLLRLLLVQLAAESDPGACNAN